MSIRQFQEVSSVSLSSEVSNFTAEKEIRGGRTERGSEEGNKYIERAPRKLKGITHIGKEDVSINIAINADIAVQE